MRAPALALAGLLGLAGLAAAGHGQLYHFGWEAVGGQDATEGTTRPGGTASVPLALPGNITRLVLHLDWAAAGGPWLLRAVGPEGSQERRGATPPLLLELPVGAAREGRWSVAAPNETAAWAAVAADQPPDLRQAGNWTVEITAGAERVPAGWQLTVIWNGYAARLHGVQPEPHPPPTAATPVGPVPVPPGGGTGLALLLFASAGVSVWALLARWRRRRDR